jgi:hypothetical protein
MHWCDHSHAHPRSNARDERGELGSTSLVLPYYFPPRLGLISLFGPQFYQIWSSKLVCFLDTAAPPPLDAHCGRLRLQAPCHQDPPLAAHRHRAAASERYLAAYHRPPTQPEHHGQRRVGASTCGSCDRGCPHRAGRDGCLWLVCAQGQHLPAVDQEGHRSGARRWGDGGAPVGSGPRPRRGEVSGRGDDVSQVAARLEAPLNQLHVSTPLACPACLAAGRYHLYVSLACPWACRCVAALHMKVGGGSSGGPCCSWRQAGTPTGSSWHAPVLCPARPYLALPYLTSPGMPTCPPSPSQAGPAGCGWPVGDPPHLAAHAAGPG